MSPTYLLIVISLYFLLLLAVAYFTSRNAGNNAFFIGNRNSNWMLVAFGMIGTSLSGITFVSVPGNVGSQAFAYMQITFGYFIGYLVVAYVLLPLYYRLQLTSIYTYLHTRLGFSSYKIGAAFFLLSRTLGATARLYLVVNILQGCILSNFGIPFWFTTVLILLMIVLYTFRGGVKTIVWTDTLQTFCMLAGLIICGIFILQQMGYSLGSAFTAMQDAGYTQLLVTDPNSKAFFLKQLLAGAFITIAMTGLDQEMMQKNISIKNLRGAQKNMVSLAFIMVFVTFSFLVLGGLLHLYAPSVGVNTSGDELFPLLALNYMPPAISIIFIIALISALFPSADGAITALTSSFSIDIIGINRMPHRSETWRIRTRQVVHLCFAFIFLVLIMVFKYIDNKSMINVILAIAGYTYGPLLGLFAFGILTSREVDGNKVPWVCLLAPSLCFLLNTYQAELLGNFGIGLELIIINGALVFGGLWLFSHKKKLEK